MNSEQPFAEPGVSYSAETQTPVDLTVAGWFLVVAALFELAVHRLASSLGFFQGVGATGALGLLATSAQVAVTAVGAMSLVLACVNLLRILVQPNAGWLPIRVILLLVTPCCLPVLTVTVFRPVSGGLVLLGYFAAVISLALVALLAALRPIGGGPRRAVIAVALLQALGMAALVARWLGQVLGRPGMEIAGRDLYLFAEIVFVLAPILCFFTLHPGSLRAFLLRPHVAGLAAGLVATGVAIAAALRAGNETVLTFVGLRTVGVSLALPGGPVLYIVALFFGAFLIGALILPSRRWPPTRDSRRIGFGLACVFMAGIQPTHPYLYGLMLAGFLYLCRGIMGEGPEGSHYLRTAS